MMKIVKYLIALNRKLNARTKNNYTYKYKEYGSTTNPASGLTVCGGLDINGNSYGSSGSDYHRR